MIVKQARALVAEHMGALIARARCLDAELMSVSWCQGLAGIGPVLPQAGAVLNDASFTRLARQAADACIGYVPRLNTLGRCCGGADRAARFLPQADQSLRSRQRPAESSDHPRSLVRP